MLLASAGVFQFKAFYWKQIDVNSIIRIALFRVRKKSGAMLLLVPYSIKELACNVYYAALDLTDLVKYWLLF